jgi:hypothetical protein
MVSISERLESLRGFKPVKISSIKFQKTNYDFYFNPMFGYFGLSPELDSESIPIIISTNDMSSSFRLVKVSSLDKVEKITLKAKKVWDSLEDDLRCSIIDKIPLNSFYITGYTI